MKLTGAELTVTSKDPGLTDRSTCRCSNSAYIYSYSIPANQRAREARMRFSALSQIPPPSAAQSGLRRLKAVGVDTVSHHEAVPSRLE